MCWIALPAAVQEVILVDGSSVDDTIAVAPRVLPEHRGRPADPEGQRQRAGLRIRRRPPATTS